LVRVGVEVGAAAVVGVTLGIGLKVAGSVASWAGVQLATVKIMVKRKRGNALPGNDKGNIALTFVHRFKRAATHSAS
jgi:hypothetical protein